MLSKLKPLFRSKFIRNVLLVATGTAGAQAITMAFAPLVTRLYGPEAFGLLGTFQAILAVATPIAVLATALTLVVLLGKNHIANLLNIQVIANFLWLIPIAMLFSALQQVMQQWLIRKNQFKITARIAVSQSFILNSTKVGAGWFYPTGLVLILLTTLGNALYTLQLWFGSKRWSKPQDHISYNSNKTVSLKSLAHQHRDFPYYRAPQVFLNAISQSFPTLLLVAVFNPAIAGLFTR